MAHFSPRPVSNLNLNDIPLGNIRQIQSNQSIISRRSQYKPHKHDEVSDFVVVL